MYKIEISRIELSELIALQQISIQTFKETFEDVNSKENMQKYLLENFSKAALEKEISNQNSIFYFAKIENKNVGYIKLNFGNAQSENKDENSVEVERIYVLKEYLGKKIGQHLFDKAVLIAKEKNTTFIWLGVWQENRPAIQFYLKNGFTVFSQHIFMLGNDPQIDLMMKLELV